MQEEKNNPINTAFETFLHIPIFSLSLHKTNNTHYYQLFLLDWTKSITSVKASFYKTAEVLLWISPVFSSVLQWQYKFFIKRWITSNKALGLLFHSAIIHIGPLSQVVNDMLMTYHLKYHFLYSQFILPPFWQNVTDYWNYLLKYYKYCLFLLLRKEWWILVSEREKFKSLCPKWWFPANIMWHFQ